MDVFKPLNKLSFALRCAQCIYIGKNPSITVMVGGEFYRGSIRVLKHHIPRDNTTMPDYNGPPKAPTDGRKQRSQKKEDKNYADN